MLKRTYKHTCCPIPGLRLLDAVALLLSKLIENLLDDFFIQ
jgi:hypothetical protein